MRMLAVLAPALALLGLVAACGGEPPPEPEASVAEPSVTAPAPASATRQGEDRIAGTVVANHLGCRKGGACYMTVRVDGDEVRVLYHPGESPRCANPAAANAGQEVEVGARVEVFGRYGRFEGRRVLSTCDSEDYYIRA